MNILLVIYEWPLGSPQTIRWMNLLRYFLEEGHSLTILSAKVGIADRPVDQGLVDLVELPTVQQYQVPARARDHTCL